MWVRRYIGAVKWKCGVMLTSWGPSIDPRAGREILIIVYLINSKPLQMPEIWGGFDTRYLDLIICFLENLTWKPAQEMRRPNPQPDPRAVTTPPSHVITSPEMRRSTRVLKSLQSACICMLRCKVLLCFMPCTSLNTSNF